MEVVTIQKYLNKIIRILAFALVFFVFFGLFIMEALKKPPKELDIAVQQHRKVLQAAFQAQSKAEIKDPNMPDPWPPMMNALYPEIELIDQKGVTFKLSSLKGKVLLVEWVDMSSPVSQALSGAATHGVFAPAQEYDKSIKTFETLLSEETSGEVKLPHPDIMTVKIIIHGQNSGQATPDDAEKWAAFFKMTRENNQIVAVPVKDLRGEKTDKIVPGIQLVDKEMELRVDSAGPIPKHNLQLTLVPHVPKLLK